MALQDIGSSVMLFSPEIITLRTHLPLEFLHDKIKVNFFRSFLVGISEFEDQSKTTVCISGLMLNY